MSERSFRRAFRLALGGRRRIEQEMDEELAFHLQARIEQLERRGLSPTEARAEAVRRFGSLHDARPRLHRSATRTARRVWMREHLEGLGHDVRHTVRALRRTPGFVAVTLLTLAIGIGADTAVVGLVSAVLLRMPPYANPQRLVMIWQQLPSVGDGPLGASPPEYVDYRDRNRAFASVGGYANLDLNLTGDGAPERIQAARVTSSLFPTLGVTPLLGRIFSAEDDRPGAAKVVVISYGLWQRRFGGDARALGRAMRLDEQPYTIVGVMPREFEFPWRGTPLSDRAELWIPMAFSPAELQARAESYDVRMIARLAPGVTLARARADVARIVAAVRREHPDVYTGNVQTRATAEPLAAEASASARPLLLTLLGAVGFVLLIACANVASLLLARAIARQRETAVRRALGASVGQVLRHAMVEAMLLASVGGAAGLALAYIMVGLVRSLGPAEIPGLAQAHLDARVLAFTVGLTLVTALLCGTAPALRATRHDAQQALRQGGRNASDGRERQHARAVLVALEAASAMLLLVAAGLLVHSFIQVLRVPPGFDPDGVVMVRTTFDRNRYASDDARRVAEHDIVERLARLPGVVAVGLTTHVPLADERRIGFAVDGRDPNEFHWAQNALVGDGYFRAMGIPLRRGRTFSAQDAPDAPAVAVINETMGRQYWPHGDPVGRAVLWGGRRLTIIGVVGDVRVSALDAPVQPTIYNSVFQVTSGATRFAVFLVRAPATTPATMLNAMRDVVWSVDRALPAFGGTTLRAVVSRSLATRRFVVLLLGAFAVTALALAVVGLHGVLSYSVTQRMPELGVRLALGARPSDLSWLVVRFGLRVAGAGIAVGALASLAAGTLIARLLFGVRPLDPMTYLVSIAALAGISLLASLAAARRAAHVDPTTALRVD